MRHFTTLTGETLGTTLAGGKGKGRQLLQTKKEEQLMWTLKDKDLILCDGCEWLAEEMMDLFLKESTRLTKEQFLAKGFKESRWEEGLSMQKGLSDDGRTFLMR